MNIDYTIVENHVAGMSVYQPNTTKVLQGERSAEILRTEIISRGLQPPNKQIQSIKFNSKGTYPSVARAKLFVTTDRDFLYPVQICTATVDANGYYNFVLDTPYELPHGRHYL